MSGVTETYGGTEPRMVGGRYELGQVIGYGGMAEVYRGRDIRLGREVAVKTLRADLARDPTFLARFRREAQSSAALNHPSIVSVYDTGEDTINGIPIPYIVMEYLEGRTLRDVLQQEGRFTERRAFEIVSDVCAALDTSHRMGIIHRDIKPANVMLVRDGSVKVMDFGIARATAATSSMTQTAAVIGTAQYLSPEQARGQRVDARSDVYSTGVLLYELMTGEPPFRGDSPVAVAYQHVREDPEPPSTRDPGISPDADAIVFKAMAKNPDARYQTAGQMRDDLERALAGRRVYAPPIGGGGGATRLMGPATTGTAVISRSPDDGYGGGYDSYNSYRDPYGPDDGYYGDEGYYGDDGPPSGPREPEPEPPPRRSDAWKWILAGLSVIVVFVAVAVIATKLLGGSGGNNDAGTIVVPRVVGQLSQDATNNIKSLGFTGDIKTTLSANTDKPKDTVLDVLPAPGRTVAKNGTITLTVATGNGRVPVPDVRGKTVDEASRVIETAGLRVTQKIFTGITPYGAGLVASTDPPVGSSVVGGGSVSVTLNVASSNAAVPDVTGQTFQAASQQLAAAGFKANQQAAPEGSGGAPGTVVDENPGPNSQAPRGSTITLIVIQQGASSSPTSTLPGTGITLPGDNPSSSSGGGGGGGGTPSGGGGGGSGGGGSGGGGGGGGLGGITLPGSGN